MAAKSKAKNPAATREPATRLAKAYMDDPSARLLLACAFIAKSHTPARDGRNNFTYPLPFWTTAAQASDFGEAFSYYRAAHREVLGKFNARAMGHETGLSAGAARGMAALAAAAGEPASAKLSAAFKLAAELDPEGPEPTAPMSGPLKEQYCKLFCRSLAPGILAMHAAEPSEADAAELFAAGRDRLSGSYGLAPEQSDALLADKPACLALCRLAFRGGSDPGSLPAFARSGWAGQLQETLALIYPEFGGADRLAPARSYYMKGDIGLDKEPNVQIRAKIEEMTDPGAPLPEAHPLHLAYRIARQGSAVEADADEVLKMALCSLQSEDGLNRTARRALLRGTSTLDEGEASPAKDPWAKIGPLGDLPSCLLAHDDNAPRPAGINQRGDSLRAALTDFQAIFRWRNPSHFLRSAAFMGQAALEAGRGEAEGYAKLAPQALALAMDEAALDANARRELASALAERFARGFSGLGESPDPSELLPGFERALPKPSEQGPKGWCAGDFQDDPMAGVALAAAKLHGVDAPTAAGLVGEAKRAFSERQGLSNAAWKAMAANPQLRDLFSQAAQESARAPKARTARKGILRQAEEVMEQADRDGTSASARIHAISARKDRSHPVDAAAATLSAGAALSLPADDQAEILNICALEQASKLRAFLSGDLPCLPGELSSKTLSMTAAAAAMPLLAEDLAAIPKMAATFLKGLSARHRRGMKTAQGEAGLLAARRHALREFEDVIDCAKAMPPGFWSRLDPKDPFSHAKRIHREWTDELARRRAGSDASMGAAWPSLVDRDGHGRASAVEMTSGRDLFEEGAAMHHCVSSYSSKCQSGAARIVSLRLDGARSSTLELAPHDSKGGRIASLDFDNLEQRRRVKSWKAVQHRGKCNAAVTHPELLALADLIEERASSAFNAYTEKLAAQRRAEAEDKLKSKAASTKALGM